MRGSLALLIVALANVSYAAVPLRLDQQGRFLKMDGSPETGSLQVTFSLYDAASSGTLLWTEVHDVTPDAGGYYSIILNAKNDDPDFSSRFSGGSVFLGLTISNESEMTPRQPLVSVPYALNALKSADGSPPGSVIAFAGASAPSGWLLCNGQEVSRSTYSALFAVIGTAYGSTGAATFTLPDFRGRVPMGVDAAGLRVNAASAGGAAAGTLGGAGGAQTHTLVVAEMPSHTHNVYTVPNYVGGSAPFQNGVEGGNPITSTATGGGGAHSNTQPWQTVNFIIRY